MEVSDVLHESPTMEMSERNSQEHVLHESPRIEMSGRNSQMLGMQNQSRILNGNVSSDWNEIRKGNQKKKIYLPVGTDFPKTENPDLYDVTNPN